MGYAARVWRVFLSENALQSVARPPCQTDQLGHKRYAPPMPTLYVVRHGRVASDPVDPLIAQWSELIELGQSLQAGYDSTLKSKVS
jgi:hypothetical protein